MQTLLKQQKKEWTVLVLYHPEQNVFALWRDHDFPYEHFWNDRTLLGWNAWADLWKQIERGYEVICEL